MTKKPGTANKTPMFSKKRIEQILTQAREYQRTGQHEKAIELCTQTLDDIGEGNSRTVQMQINLLSTRFESNLSQLRREAAGIDVALLIKLADKTDSPALKAKSLICMGRIQANQGQNELARKTLSTALKLSQQNGQKRLEAETLVALWGVQSGERQIENVKQAADIYLSLGDKYHAGLALTRVAGSFRLAGRIDEARHAAHQTLEICKEVGNLLGVGHAYNTISNTDTDLVSRLKHQKLSSQAFEVVGHLGQLAGTANNLGYIYYGLGLYSRAQRYYRKALEIYPAHFYPLANRIYIELETKALTQAQEHIAELQTMIREEKIYNYDLTIMTDLLGRMALLEDKPKAAIRHFKSAISHSQKAGHATEIGLLALLGKAQLAMDEPLAALRSTNKAIKMHRERDFPLVDDHPSQGIWWQHAKVLYANQKSEAADKALEKAYGFLLNEIGNTRDAGLRRNYFNKIALNREIIQAWSDYATRKKLPRERRYDHLQIKSRAREPFARLAEVGLELNALQSVQAIQTFLVEEATEVIGGERVLLILDDDGKLVVAESYLPVGEDATKSFVVARKYLEKARISRTVQLLGPKGKGRGRIVAPLVAQNKLLGYLYTEMDSIYGKFDEADRDMLGMLANQGAVALENARTLEGLEKTVEERTEELQASNAVLGQRNTELAIINSVQDGLAKQLDFQGIVDLIGDKVCEIFKADTTYVMSYDAEQDWEFNVYYVDRGQRVQIPDEPLPRPSLVANVMDTCKPLLTGSKKESGRLGGIAEISPGKDEDKNESYLGVPILRDNKPIGVINVQSYDENAYSQGDLRLLQTLANSMSVALENARLFDETQRLLKETEQRNTELAVINGVQQALASRLDAQGIFEAVGEQLRKLSDFQAVEIFSFNLNSYTVSKVYGYKKGEKSPCETEPSNSFFEYLVKLQSPLVINGDFSKFIAKFNDYRVPKDKVPHSFLYVPVKYVRDEKSVILLTIQEMDSGRTFQSTDARLLETIAGLMSIALERRYLRDQEQAYLRALEHEMEIGRDIQMSFLPSELPVFEGWEIDASLKAAREVAGDFYDVFLIGSGENICLVVGDVCDKGVGAALFMTLFRSLLRFTMGVTNLFGERASAAMLRYAVTLTNNYIADTHGDTGMFATIFFGMLEPKKGVLTYINAGHEPPVVFKKDGTQIQLPSTGLSVGVIPDWEFKVEQVLIDPGDLLFAFTDGAPEMNNPAGEFFGKDTLLELAKNNATSASGVVAEIKAHLIDYIGDGNQFDDITLMAVRRLEN